MKKKSFYEIILKKIEELIPQVRASKAAEGLLKEFGDILKQAILTKDEVEKVYDDLISIRGNLSKKGDTASTYKYLTVLEEEMFNRFVKKS